MKISRRNYISITVIMLVVFFMTMFSGTAKAVLSNYTQNEYADLDGADLGVASSDAYTVKEIASGDSSSDYVIYAGSDEGTSDMLKEWCRYTRKDLMQVSDLNSIGKLNSLPEFVLADGSLIQDNEDVTVFANLCNTGVNIILSEVPSDGIVESSKELCGLIGVSFIRAKDINMTGIWLYDDFLLGGETMYFVEDEDDPDKIAQQDLDLNINWYALTSETTRFMRGEVEDELFDEVTKDEEDKNYDEEEDGLKGSEAYKNEYMPPVIWSKINDNNTVFVVNGDYMKNDIGLGMISAMEYQLSDYQLYSVVNAQNFSVVNFPSLTEENTEQMNKIYSRNSLVVERDLIWPGITAIALNNSLFPGCFLTAKIGNDVGNSLDTEFMDYFFRSLRESDGEAGINADADDGTDVAEELSYERSVLEEYYPDYRINSAYIGDTDDAEAMSYIDKAGFEDISVLLGDYDSQKGYLCFSENDTVRISTVNEGVSHTFSQDLLERSLETFMGYSQITADLSCLLYPEDEDDEWQNYYDKLSSYTNTYWQDFNAFTEVSVSELAKRTRSYLTTSYKVSDEGKYTVNLKIDSKSEENYFVFRTHSGDVISTVEGGTFEQIEDNAWLITTLSDEVNITYRSRNNDSPFN